MRSMRTSVLVVRAFCEHDPGQYLALGDCPFFHVMPFLDSDCWAGPAKRAILTLYVWALHGR